MKTGFFIRVAVAAWMLGLCVAQAQESVSVLFVGNSYTAVNDLPQMTANIASNMGYGMTYESNTPGGCTFSQHCTNQSMTMIRNGGWDFVVLQEQSQYPSFPQEQVEAEVFPYAIRLVDSVYSNNRCAEPVFYMTWGRKNGDAGNAQFFPVLGTYEGMDSMLYERYMYMAEVNDASVCPVGRVWRYLRTNHPEIELYQSDGSHPSVEGTYAAACAFFVMFFGDNPEGITFVPSGMEQQNARKIRHAVHEVVFTRMSQWKRPLPRCEITSIETNDSEAYFVANTEHADSLIWNFGDGTTAAYSTNTAAHHYTDTGRFEVTLVATRHCMTDTARVVVYIAGDTSQVGVVPTTSSESGDLTIRPNPATTMPTLTIDGVVISPENADISITNAEGRPVPYPTTTNGKLPSGLYLLHVVYNNRLFTGKFVISSL
ncbi:MAG: T9SS type A sorting domain-containing protein [Bacteroidales bacterium]|nr:T9SS type A sorting domain-containing protein [Bacteroidales bacterium]